MSNYLLQSTRAPDCLTIRAHLFNSLLLNAANSSDVLPTGSAPKAKNFSRTSGNRVMWPISDESFSTIAAGVDAGAHMPYHVLKLKPGIALSEIVGMFESADDLR
jgi:hypothetical protein